ncbi:MAG TPA: ethanolamine ammonia-lyase reactivating factor EutA [Pirellulales bacterium]|nr:ethanolamine ammonia-lyase reactivating factor EutA [Pirellulales bacterium]
MSRSIHLLGLDCGSTTTSAMIARGRLAMGALGRMETTQLEVIYRSERVFTPFAGQTVDLDRMAEYLDDWMRAASIEPGKIFGGGALVTGLAGQATNAAAITKLIETRLAGSVVASANDPVLESWLAFMGNCHALSLAHPELPILNLDIGGGTTNLAWGQAGQVIDTGCLFVGARHFQFVPGTYQLAGFSSHGAALLNHLNIGRRVGDALPPAEVNAILDWYLALLEAIAGGDDALFQSAIGRLHRQVAPTAHRRMDSSSCITLSGGVGELAYGQLAETLPMAATQFGDLGGELATRILLSPTLAPRIGTLLPEGLGRATVFGLLRHGTEISGSTLYLSDPGLLPLPHVPIVGRIGTETTDDDVSRLVDLAWRARPAGAIQIDLNQFDLAAVRGLAGRMAVALERRPAASAGVLVAIVAANVAKALGSYMTRWGTLKVNLIVIDEVPTRDAQFIRLGRVVDGAIGVSFYGMR